MYDTWQSYFYPETYNPATGQGTLRNLFGERDAAALSLREYAYTLSRASNLTYGVADVERTFDAEHLRAIHRYLFQDVFEWAGQYRSVNMSKNINAGHGYRYAETGLPYTQDSATLAYLLELSPIFASCHHRFCIEDFPSPNPSRFKPRPYRGISIKNRDKTNTTWPTKNSSHNESNPHLSAL